MPKAPSPWPTIRAERAALAEDLATLTPQQWASPSWCAGWSVQQAVAHMVATAKLTPRSFAGKMLRSRFRFGVMVEHEVLAWSAGTPAQTLADFRSIVEARTAPPGPVDSWLGEVIVHAEDVRRPLGIAHEYPTEAVVRTAKFYQGSHVVVGSKSRIAGLTLRATDADWSVGSGPEVTGPALALLLAMTGRQSALGDLAGDGVETLRGRR